MLSDILREPSLKTIDIATSDRITAHRKILEAKPIMRSVCRETYALCADLDLRLFTGAGRRIELGAGASFMKDFFPDVSITDLLPAPHLDEVMDAQAMTNVKDSFVRAFFGIHCFHHLPEPRKFLAELMRTLSPGGGCVLVEPYFGFFARQLFPRLFPTEGFDMTQAAWETPRAATGEYANQALSYNVFFRDRAIFESAFPGLEIVYADQLTSYPRYLLSGGLNFRSLVPRSSTPILKGLEKVLSPLRSVLAVHHVIVLRKRS